MSEQREASVRLLLLVVLVVLPCYSGPEPEAAEAEVLAVAVKAIYFQTSRERTKNNRLTRVNKFTT